MHKWFAILSLAVLVSFEATVVRDARREWKGWQRAFERLEGSLAPAPGSARKRGTPGSRPERRANRNGDYEIHQVVLAPLGRVDRCPTCHLGLDRPELAEARQPFGSHPGPYLSQHAPERFGCTLCHGGQGVATRTRAAHGRVKDWPEPLWPSPYIQSSCGRCHPISLLREPIFLQGRKLYSQDNDLAGALLLSEGRKLFQERGCWACHKVEGYRGLEKPGPPLSRIGEKVGPDWLLQWLKNPQAYLPRTAMPNFGLTHRQALSLTAYLLTRNPAAVRASKAEGPEPGPRANEAPGSPEREAARKRGGQLFRQARCISCHALEGRGGLIGPALDRIGDKAKREWLIQWIADPRRYYPRSHMPRFRFSPEEREALVDYLLQELSEGEDPGSRLPPGSDPGRDPALLQEGKRLVKELGCFGCHEIPGFEQEAEVGPELTRFGDKPPEELDFGRLAGRIARTPQAWTLKKLQDPRVFRDTLKMPDPRLSLEEARALTVYLLSLSGEPVPAAYRYRRDGGDPRGPAHPPGPFGRLLRDLRCLTCHTLGARGGDLAPSLSLEGSQVTEEWLSEFLRHPNFLRPILAPRMPDFNLSPEEIRTVVESMRVILVNDEIDEARTETRGEGRVPMAREGETLYQRLGCRACHQLGLRGGSLGPELTRVGARLKEGWIFRWLKDPQRYRPGALQPDYGLSDHEASALAIYLADLKEEPRNHQKAE